MWSAQVEEVFAICPEIDKEAIQKDLEITKNVQTTINRILDGQLVKGGPYLHQERVHPRSIYANHHPFSSTSSSLLTATTLTPVHQNNLNSSSQNYYSGSGKFKQQPGKCKKKEEDVVVIISSDDDENISITSSRSNIDYNKSIIQDTYKSANVDISNDEECQQENDRTILSQSSSTSWSKKYNQKYTSPLSLTPTASSISNPCFFDTPKAYKSHFPIQIRRSDRANKNILQPREFDLQFSQTSIHSSHVSTNYEEKCTFTDKKYDKNDKNSSEEDTFLTVSLDDILQDVPFKPRVKNRKIVSFDEADEISTSFKNGQERENINPLSNLNTVGDDVSSFTNSKKKRRVDKDTVDLKEEKRIAKELEKLKKQQEKELKILQKQKENEEKQRLKEIEEEEKRRAQENKKVNRIRQKAETVQEMIVQFEKSLADTSFGTVAMSKVQEEGAAVQSVNSTIPNTVLWKRRVTKEWNNEEQCWLGCPQRIEEENFVMVIFQGTYLAEMLIANQAQSQIKSIQSNFPGKKLIIVIENIKSYFRKIERKTRDNFNNALRSLDGSAASTTFQPLKQIKKSDLDAFYLWLQIDLNCLVQFANSAGNTVEYLLRFTREISLLPEIKRRSEAAFDLNFSDTIKSGTSLSDTFNKMLQQCHMVTEHAAKAIVEVWPTLDSLYKSYDSQTGTNDAKNMLQNVRIVKGPPSNPTIRYVGKSVSQRLYDIFMSEDPEFPVNSTTY